MKKAMVLICILACIGFISSICILDKKIECGKVQEITSATLSVSGKYNNVERYLIIKFDNGKTEAVNSDPTTYYTAKIDKRVCYNRYNEMAGAKIIIAALIGFILLIVYINLIIE